MCLSFVFLANGTLPVLGCSATGQAKRCALSTEFAQPNPSQRAGWHAGLGGVRVCITRLADGHFAFELRPFINALASVPTALVLATHGPGPMAAFASCVVGKLVIENLLLIRT